MFCNIKFDQNAFCAFDFFFPYDKGDDFNALGVWLCSIVRFCSIAVSEPSLLYLIFFPIKIKSMK